MTEDKIICPRCGEEMKSSSRYCMKCGYLNYNHPDNAKLQGFKGKLQDTTAYVNGAAQLKEFNGVKKDHELSFSSNTGSKRICFFINISLYLVILVIIFLFYNSRCEQLIDVFYTSFPFLTILFSLFFMYLYAIELIFMKMNERWWVPFIPIYNVFVLSNKVMGSYWFGIISLIPVVSLFYFLVLTFKLGVKFGYNGLFFMIFWPILIPMCGFSDNTFDGVTYVAGIDSSALEKEYKLKNTFIVLVSTILVVFLGILGYINRGIFKDPINTIKKHYYVYAAKTIVSDVKNDIRIRTIYCDHGVYMSSNDGEYYFHYLNANTEVNLLFGSSRDVIESYVKVVNTNGDVKYYISLSDGTYGIREIEISKISVDDVKKMTELSDRYLEQNTCRVKKNG